MPSESTPWLVKCPQGVKRPTRPRAKKCECGTSRRPARKPICGCSCPKNPEGMSQGDGAAAATIVGLAAEKRTTTVGATTIGPGQAALQPEAARSLVGHGGAGGHGGGVATAGVRALEVA